MASNVSCEKKITSSWGNSDELEGKSQISSVDVGLTDMSIDDFVVLDSCVCLVRGENTEAPEITIRLNSLNRIDIASEGINISVLNDAGFELATLVSDFVDEWEGFGVYYSKYLIVRETTSITLRFTKMKNPDHLWIYGLRLQVYGPRSSLSMPSFSNADKLTALQDCARKFYNLKMYGEGDGNTNQRCKNCDSQIHEMEKRLNVKLDLMESNLKKFIEQEQEKMLLSIKELLK